MYYKSRDSLRAAYNVLTGILSVVMVVVVGEMALRSWLKDAFATYGKSWGHKKSIIFGALSKRLTRRGT